MKTKLFFAVCLTIMTAVASSCGNKEYKNDKPFVLAPASPREIEKDSLMLISEIWQKIATDKNMDFSQDTTHVLIERKNYNIKAIQNGDCEPLNVIFENNKDGYMASVIHGAGPRCSSLEGCSLIYKGKHNEFNHYVLVIDREVFAKAQAEAKAARVVIKKVLYYSDGTVEEI